MSSVVQLNCNNEACDFEVTLSNGSPVWREDTPKELRKVPVMSINKKYVIEKVSDKLCTNCGVVVSVQDTTYVCPSCAGTHSFLKENDICPNCNSGVVKEDTNSRIWF